MTWPIMFAIYLVGAILMAALTALVNTKTHVVKFREAFKLSLLVWVPGMLTFISAQYVFWEII